MADGSVTIEVGLDKKEFDKGINSISSSINNMIPSASSALSGLSSAFTSVGNVCTSLGKACSTVTGTVAGVFVSAASKAYDFIDTYESAMAVFEKRLGETGATDMYNQLLDIAKGSKYAQEYMISAGQTLIGMGIDATDTAKYVQVATDAISAMGGTGADVESLAEMFGKMSMQTTLYTNDLNQLLTNGIPVYDILAKKYDTSTDAIKQMASAGELTSKDFEYLMDVLGGNVEGMEEFSLEGMALATKTGTLSGAVDSLNSSFRTFALNLLDLDPRTESGKENINGLCQVVETLGAILEDLGDKFSFVGEWLKDFISKIATVTTTVDEDGNVVKEYGGILGKFKDVLDSLDTETLEKIASGIGKVAAAGPTLLVAGSAFKTLGSACSGLSTASKTVESFGGKITSVFTTLQKDVENGQKSFKTFDRKMNSSLVSTEGKVKTVFDAIGNTASSLGSTMTKAMGFTAVAGAVVAGLGLVENTFGDKIDDICNTCITKGQDVITNFCDGITSKIPDLISQGSNLIQQFLDVIISCLPSIINGGIELITSLITGMANELPNLLPKIVELVVTIVKSLVDNIPLLVDAGIQLLEGLIEGIIECIPVLLGMLPDLINSIVTTLTSCFSLILNAGVDLLLALVNGIIECIPVLIDTIPEVIDSFITSITESLPQIINAGIQLLLALVNGIIECIPVLVEEIPTIIDTIVTALTELLPTIVDAGVTLLLSLIDGIVECIPQLVAMLPQIIDTIITTLTGMLPIIIEMGVTLLISLINGIIECIPQLVGMLPQIIDTIITTLTGMLPTIIEMGITLLLQLITGLIQAIPQLVAMLPQIIDTIITTLTGMLPTIVDMGITLLIQLATGLIQAIPQLVGMLPQIITAIINAFTSINWAETGKNIIKGILNGLGNCANLIKDTVKNVCNSILGSIKSFFGIASPSKLMRDEIGEYLPAGIAVGIEANTDEAVGSMQDLCEDLVDSIDVTSAFDELNSAVEVGTISLSDRIVADNTATSGISTNNVDNSKTTEINNVQNFYSTQETPYEEQIEAKRQLRRLAYDLS